MARYLTRSKKNAIRIANKKRFRRFLIIMAIVVLLAIFEIYYLQLSSMNRKIPVQISDIKQQTETLDTENAKTRKEIKEDGGYEARKEIEDSWERLRDRLAEELDMTTE